MKVNVLLFDNFETLDVFGPVEIFGRMPEDFEIDYYSLTGGIVTSTQGVKIMTKNMGEREDENDLFFIPGGKGTRKEVDNTGLIKVIKETALSSRFVLTVCTGSALLAKTGLLDGWQATSNKRAMEWVMSVREEVEWKRKARWTRDGKYYTSSGISAGMDMALGFIGDLFGKEQAKKNSP